MSAVMQLQLFSHMAATNKVCSMLTMAYVVSAVVTRADMQFRCLHYRYAIVMLKLHNRSNNAGFQDLISSYGAGRQLSAVLASSDPVVRMRAIALVIGLGGQSEAAVKALQQSGVQLHHNLCSSTYHSHVRNSMYPYMGCCSCTHTAA